MSSVGASWVKGENRRVCGYDIRGSILSSCSCNTVIQYLCLKPPSWRSMTLAAIGKTNTDYLLQYTKCFGLVEFSREECSSLLHSEDMCQYVWSWYWSPVLLIILFSFGQNPFFHPCRTIKGEKGRKEVFLSWKLRLSGGLLLRKNSLTFSFTLYLFTSNDNDVLKPQWHTLQKCVCVFQQNQEKWETLGFLARILFLEKKLKIFQHSVFLKQFLLSELEILCN